MKTLKRIFENLILIPIRFHYETTIELIHKIKTGEDKFYDEIKRDKASK